MDLIGEKFCDIYIYMYTFRCTNFENLRFHGMKKFSNAID